MTPEKRKALTPVETPKPVLEAMRDLIALGTREVPRIPEDVFVRGLLPILVSRSGETDLRVWQDIAGSINRPIDVMDASGAVLFRVPSLFNNIPTTENRTARVSLTEAMVTAEKKRQISPIVGESFLRQTLNSRVPTMIVDKERIQQWNAILIRYGHEPMVVEGVDLPPVAEIGTSASAEPQRLVLDQDEEF